MVVLPFQAPGLLQGASPAQRLAHEHAERLARYQELRDFYAGRHFRGRRPGRTQLVANYARAIVDKQVAYAFARGVFFTVADDRRGGSRPAGPARPGRNGRSAVQGSDQPLSGSEVLTELLAEAGLQRSLLQAATNASVVGDAVLKLFWNAERRAPNADQWPLRAPSPALRVLNIDPARFFPTFASDDPHQLREVAVVSAISPDEAAERYRLALARPAELLEIWRRDSLQVLVGPRTVFAGPNPYGFIPFVHVPNLAPPGSAWGRSDLEDIIPLNRELDERLSDQADVIRYHADPPVIFKGVREHSDLAVGPGTVWDVPAGAEVELLEWRGQAPAVDRHIDRVLRALYDVAEAPRSSFGDTEQAFSGVALETQLQPIVQRTLRRRIIWEAALRELARQALVLAETFRWRGLQPGVLAPYRVSIHWPPLLPRDDVAEANRLIALTGAGLRSLTGAMAELGVADPQEELGQVAADRQRLGPPRGGFGAGPAADQVQVEGGDR